VSRPRCIQKGLSFFRGIPETFECITREEFLKPTLPAILVAAMLVIVLFSGDVDAAPQAGTSTTKGSTVATATSAPTASFAATATLLLQTNLSLTTSTTAPFEGQNVTLTGRLTASDNALSDRTITLERGADAQTTSWTFVANATTNATGAASSPSVSRVQAL